MYLYYLAMEDYASLDNDPIIGYRQAKYKLLLDYRQSTLNAEGLRVMYMSLES